MDVLENEAKADSIDAAKSTPGTNATRQTSRVIRPPVKRDPAHITGNATAKRTGVLASVGAVMPRTSKGPVLQQTVANTTAAIARS